MKEKEKEKEKKDHQRIAERGLWKFASLINTQNYNNGRKNNKTKKNMNSLYE